MKTPAAILTALLFSAPAYAQEGIPSTGHVDSEDLAPGELELAEELGNRIAGEPQACLPLRGLRNMSIIEGTAIVFDYGTTIYVNRTTAPDALRENDRLVTRRTLGRMCRLDVVRKEDRFNGFYTGTVSMDEFVPYRRIDG